MPVAASELKTGRLPPVHTMRMMRSALIMDRALNYLGPPPPVCRDYLTAVQNAGGFRMFGNDQYGDCVWADTGNAIILNTANTGAALVLPDADVLWGYSAVTGFNAGPPPTHDEGTQETDAMNFLRSTGIRGQTIENWGTLDPTNKDALKWAIYIFGGVRLGVLVDASMMQLFADGNQPWVNPVANGGGHDIRLVHYDENWFYAATWGGIQPVSPALVANRYFCDEAHAEIWMDWLNKQGVAPSGLNMPGLTQDLRALEAA